MKIKITADSTLDLNDECLKKYNIDKIGLNVLLGEDEYIDGENIENQKIFDSVTKNGVLPKTSARSIEDYKEFFKKYTDDGFTVIHFNIGSTLSASIKSATCAASEMSDVFVIDSENLSSGTGLLAIYASELAKSGLTASEIVEKTKARIGRVQASFIIDNLKYLYKGGRCSALSLLGANLLRLKPTILVKEGKLIVGKKYRGNFVKVLEQYVDDTLMTFNSPDLSRICITYSSATPEMVEIVRTKIKEHFNFKEIIETVAGATITSHCGPNTLGILYINDGKSE